LRLQNGLAEHVSGAAWNDVTGGVTISTNPNNRWVFQIFRENSIFTNGVDTPLKWPGIGNVTEIARDIDGGPDTIDRAATLVRHRERTVLGDVTATQGGVDRFESVIWPSTSGTLDTWEASPLGRIHIERGDGDSITNLQDVLGFLVVFKQNSLHRVTRLGSATEQDRIRVAPIGTPGPHTAIVVNSLVYFVDSSGRFYAYDVRGTNEDAIFELSSDKLGPITLNGFVGSRLQHAHLWHDPIRDEIWFFLSQGASLTETNVAWVYKILPQEIAGVPRGAFTRFEWEKNWNVSASLLDDNDDVHLIAGSHDGFVARMNSGVTDNGSTFKATFATRQMALGDLAIEKGIRAFDLYANATQGQPIMVEQRLDFENFGKVYNVDVAQEWDTLT
jgi:hypothetical protein